MTPFCLAFPKLLLVQNSAARIITRTGSFHHITPVLRQLHWLAAPPYPSHLVHVATLYSHYYYDEWNWTINTTFKRSSRLLLLQLHSHSHCGGAKYAERFSWLSVAMVNGRRSQSEAALEAQTFSVTSGATGSCSSGEKPAGGAGNRVCGWGCWGVGGVHPSPPTCSVVRGDYSCGAHSNCFDTFHACFL